MKSVQGWGDGCIRPCDAAYPHARWMTIAPRLPGLPHAAAELNASQRIDTLPRASGDAIALSHNPQEVEMGFRGG